MPQGEAARGASAQTQESAEKSKGCRQKEGPRRGRQGEPLPCPVLEHLSLLEPGWALWQGKVWACGERCCFCRGC